MWDADAHDVCAMGTNKFILRELCGRATHSKSMIAAPEQ